MKYNDLNNYIKEIVKDDAKKPSRVPVRREEVCSKDGVHDYMNDSKIRDLVCYLEDMIRRHKCEVDAEIDYITSKVDWKNNLTNNEEVKELLKNYYDKHEIKRVLPRTTPIKCEDITKAAYDIFDRPDKTF